MTTLDLALFQRAADLANADGEFRLASRWWDGSLRLEAGEHAFGAPVVDGRLAGPQPVRGDAPAGPGHVTLAGPDELWALVLAPVPPMPYHDVSAAIAGGFVLGGSTETSCQYRPALRRFVELLRYAACRLDPAPRPLPAPGRHGTHDNAVGRYIHLDLDGVDHRVYYEQSGNPDGIALLLQHTAGADARQWRHVLEDEGLGATFRMIAYDLPMHGKSVPPTGRAWWAQEYRLTREFLMSVPVTLAGALGLDRPVFMGSSIGGLAAVDLAFYHPERFRAVVALEAALKVPIDDLGILDWFFHPRISNMYKASAMIGLTSPTAPEALRQETGLVYAMGAPASFAGDLWFYLVDHDLRGLAHEIDTGRCQVHILNGEYDYATPPALGEQLAGEIKGATYQTMHGLGHFPMSEDPDRFLSYVRPVLDRIAATAR